MKIIPTNRPPGTGAVEYALSFIEEASSRTEVANVIAELLANRLHDPSSDKRIKRCDYCEFYYRDKTKNRSAKTCSHECKAAKDVIRRAAKNAEIKTTLSNKEKQYASHLEYSYWSRESDMVEYVSRYETLSDKLEQIEGAVYRKECIGGRKKGIPVISYDGTEHQQSRVNVRYAKNDTSSSEVRVSKMTAA